MAAETHAALRRGLRGVRTVVLRHGRMSPASGVFGCPRHFPAISCRKEVSVCVRIDHTAHAMSRVLLLLLITALAIGMVVALAWSPDLWKPWLEGLGLTQDDAVFRQGLKVALGIVVGIPLAALLFAIGRLGPDRTQTDIHGYTVLRPKAGTRWFLTLGALFGAALFFGYPMLDPQARAPWMFQAAGAFCLLVIPVALGSKIRYDNSTLSVSRFLGDRSVHAWSDLVEIREIPEMNHYRLAFRNRKSASVSYNYAGVEELIATARAKLAGRARQP